MKKLIKFESSTCGPCKLVAPLIEEFKDRYEIEIVDAVEDSERAVSFGVRSVPTVIIDDDGELVKLVGIQEITRANLDKYWSEADEL